MTPSLPMVITHNHDPGRGLARNLCELPPADAERVLDDIRGAGTRRIKANCLPRRHAVENRLIAERRRKLGETPLLRPVYSSSANSLTGRTRRGHAAWRCRSRPFGRKP